MKTNELPTIFEPYLYQREVVLPFEYLDLEA